VRPEDAPKPALEPVEEIEKRLHAPCAEVKFMKFMMSRGIREGRAGLWRKCRARVNRRGCSIPDVDHEIGGVGKGRFTGG
jgi:hypothetical protein